MALWVGLVEAVLVAVVREVAVRWVVVVRPDRLREWDDSKWTAIV